MTGVKPGIYRIQFQPGYMNPSLAGQWWNDAPSRSKASVITVTAGQETSGVGALMSAAGSITGVVTSDKGAPAPNVNVSFYHADGTAYGEFAGSTSTDANGEYSFGGLPADSYKIQFSPSGSLLGEWYDNAQDSERATPLVLDAGASATADAVLTTGATLSGVVTDRGGRPVENAFVLVQSVAGSGLDYAMGGYSGSDGAYSVTGLPPGMYKVQFRTDQALQNVAPAWWKSADRESKAKPLTLSAGGVTTDIDARLDAGASISGIVRDGANGPVPYAWITAFNDAGEQVAGTSVAQDGSFRLNGLAPGSYRLQFVGEADGTGMLEWWKGAGTIAAASAIAVKAGDNIAGLDVDLSRAGGGVLNTWNESLSGVVTDGLGNPLPGVVVEARSESMGDTAVSDADGVWKLPSLMPGTYRVSFTGDVGGARVTEWWNRAASAESATPLTLADGQHRTDINASLGAGALPAIPSSQPKITGPAHVGAVLKANPGSWTNGTQFTYQWYADGSPIGGETGASLAITPDLVHKQVTVLVTGSLAGYQSVSRSSAPTDPIPVP
jgi:protocatechuate 3,4-dioxygenase beta subunit